MSYTPADMFALIGTVPALPGARCRHRSHLFDPPEGRETAETVAARQAQALALCGGCPSLRRCREWFATLTPSRRPTGVIAGRIHQPPPPGRPKKEPSTA